MTNRILWNNDKMSSSIWNKSNWRPLPMVSVLKLTTAKMWQWITVSKVGGQPLMIPTECLQMQLKQQWSSCIDYMAKWDKNLKLFSLNSKFLSQKVAPKIFKCFSVSFCFANKNFFFAFNRLYLFKEVFSRRRWRFLLAQTIFFKGWFVATFDKCGKGAVVLR